MAQPLKLTDEKKAQFVELIQLGNTLTHAANLCGVSVWTVLRHRKDDPAFAEAIKDAAAVPFQAAADAMYVMGMNGNWQALDRWLRNASRRMNLPAEERWEDVQKVQHGGDPENAAPIPIQFFEIAEPDKPEDPQQ